MLKIQNLDSMHKITDIWDSEKFLEAFLKIFYVPNSLIVSVLCFLGGEVKNTQIFVNFLISNFQALAISLG